MQSFEEEFFKRIRENDAWKGISGYWDFPWSDKIIERYADKWDWKELIDNRNINWTFELFEKFKRYIPVSDFDTLKSSALWNNLVEIEQQIIAGRILSEK